MNVGLVTRPTLNCRAGLVAFGCLGAHDGHNWLVLMVRGDGVMSVD